MWGKTKTFKIVYYDNNVMYGDTRRSTFVEACNRQEAIHKFQQDYGLEYVVRDCIELPF
jgi:hypothetical protein